jgi:hypothetical protein
MFHPCVAHFPVAHRLHRELTLHEKMGRIGGTGLRFASGEASLEIALGHFELALMEAARGDHQNPFGVS